MIKGTPIIPKSDYLIEIDNAFGFVEGIQSEYDFFKPFDELIEFVEKRIEIEENKIEAEKEKFEQEFEQSMSLEEEYYRYGYSFGLRHNFLKAVYLTIYSQFEGSMKQLGYLTNKFKPGANPFDFNRSDDSLNYFISYIESRTITKKIIRKKVSLDLDVALHKRLMHIALENDAKLYELVENVLQDYVRRQK